MTEVFNYGPHDLPILSRKETRAAVECFRQGKDTDQIARRLTVPEAAVYNSLAIYRELQREERRSA